MMDSMLVLMLGLKTAHLMEILTDLMLVPMKEVETECCWEQQMVSDLVQVKVR